MKRAAFAALATSVAVLVSGLVLAAAPSVAAGSLPTLTLAVTKSSITVGGSKVAGAVNVVMTVTGEKSDGPALLLVRPGVSLSAVERAIGRLGPNTPLDAIDPYVSIVFDGVAAEGAPTSAETWLQPGTYLAVNNGNGHAVFTVAPNAHPALLPTPAATVRAIDFAFRGADTLHDGELVRFVNDGYLIHMFLFAQAKSVADATKAEALLLAGKPSLALKRYSTGLHGMFAGPLSHAELQQQVIDEPPGVYVIVCGMNAQDGRDHYELGMVRTITIVK